MSNPQMLDVVNGTVICKCAGPDDGDDHSADVIVEHDGEIHRIPIRTVKNTIYTGTRFKVIEFNLGTSVSSKLEFIKEGEEQPLMPENIFISHDGIIELDKRTGEFTTKKPGKTLIVYIFEGNKYGAVITVEEEQKRTRRKRKDEEGL